MRKLWRIGTLALLVTLPGSAQSPELGRRQLVETLRFLNTQEFTYFHENQKFATAEELLSFLQEKGKGSPVGLSPEKLEPCVLTITTAQNGQHYQISLQRPSDMHDKGTWCKPAAFSDDRGIIFLGLALDCADT